jgi:hypothetical protein
MRRPGAFEPVRRQDKGTVDVAISRDDRGSPAAAASSAPVVQMRFTRRMLLFLAVLLVGPWFLVGFLLIRSGPQQSKPPAAALVDSNETSLAEVSTGKPGPWGVLEYARISLDLPEEYVFVPPSDQPPIRWFFKGYSKERALEFLKSAALSAAQLETLRQAAWTEEADGAAVPPGDELILGLSPAARAKIYSLLVEFPQNSRQIDPVWFHRDLLDVRTKDSGLSDASMALFKRLLYRPTDSPLSLFADFEPALRQLPDEPERRRFVKMVSRKKTLLARLKVDADSDTAAMANYWGIGGRRKDAVPLLNALRRTERSHKLSIICLLPDFLRDHIYSYAFPAAGPTAVKQDCFWSAMNALNDPPDDHFGDMQYVHKVLETDYYSILKPTQLCDLVFLTLNNGDAIHAAIYVADDIVFTKNGALHTQPWMLMHESEMIDTYAVRYPSNSPLKVLYFRKKSL